MFNFLRQKDVEAVESLQFHDAVQNWSKETRFTPDLLALERKLLIPVFLPDECMSTHHKFHLISPDGRKDVTFGHAFTIEKYFMLKKETNRNSSVVIFEEGQIRGQAGVLSSLFERGSLETAPIRGELHMLDSDQVIALDNYKENTVKFIRKRIPITIPHKYKHETEDGGIYYSPTVVKTYSAHMYVAQYDQHFEHWHMTDAKRLLASIPLVKAKVPYYYNL